LSSILEKSHGSWLATLDGRRIFDWAGYFGSKLIAHNHPGLSEPEYLRNLVLAANNKTANPDFLTPQCLDYYRLLHELAPSTCAIRGWRFTPSIPARKRSRT
jgi:L-lysine 6-transaminase